MDLHVDAQVCAPTKIEVAKEKVGTLTAREKAAAAADPHKLGMYRLALVQVRGCHIRANELHDGFQAGLLWIC